MTTKISIHLPATFRVAHGKTRVALQHLVVLQNYACMKMLGKTSHI